VCAAAVTGDRSEHDEESANSYQNENWCARKLACSSRWKSGPG